MQTWDSKNNASPWSAPQQFKMAAKLGTYSTPTPSIAQASVTPSVAAMVGAGHYSSTSHATHSAGWSSPSMLPPTEACSASTWGEGQRSGGRPEPRAEHDSFVERQGHAAERPAHVPGRHPEGCCWRSGARFTRQRGAFPLCRGDQLACPTFYRLGAPGRLRPTFDDSASSFDSSNSALNQVWGYPKYSIKAPTFAGVYIDGDRDRTRYEADAYIQALGHYVIDRDYASRDIVTNT